jgi:hypothetical protein
MNETPFHRNLRLMLQGFSGEEAAEITAMVQSVWTPEAPWVVSSEAPVDGVLLTRGTRPDDPEHSAVLRVNLSMQPIPRRDAERRLEPLILRKPIRTAALRVALDAAIARIRRFRR